MGYLLAMVMVLTALSVHPVLAHVPECYEHNERARDDGTTNKGGGMYDTNFLRGWVWWKVQEMGSAKRREARTYEQIAGLIGPCLLPNGSVFHMVDRKSPPPTGEN